MNRLPGFVATVSFSVISLAGCTSNTETQDSVSEQAPFGLDASRLYFESTIVDMVMVNGEDIRPLGTATSEISRVELHGMPALRAAGAMMLS
jgi:hypothetical protein